MFVPAPTGRFFNSVCTHVLPRSRAAAAAGLERSALEKLERGVDRRLCAGVGRWDATGWFTRDEASVSSPSSLSARPVAKEVSSSSRRLM
jgi:hypothetical protein